MSSDNVFGVEPPRDASGEVIPLDTDTLYETDGQVFHVLAFRYLPKGREWSASGGYTGNKNGWCADTNRLLLAPPDSWEKLEEDALKGQCTYFGASGNSVTCTNCEHSLQATGRLCWENMQIDLVKRAKRLAGVEKEQESGERTAIADKKGER
nr:MAG TPA: hypothetical protein [Caudoviricetes sp.]